MLRFDPSDHISDFAGSDYYSLLPDAVKPHAESLLETYFSFIKEDDSSDITIVNQEKVLFTKFSNLAIDADVKKCIPKLLYTFYEFIERSGAWPGAQLWKDDIGSLEEKYNKRIRDDGSVKGETFTKKYSDSGRNDPCPCGSGKKFKKCCMGLID